MDDNGNQKQLEIPNESEFIRFYSKLEPKSDSTIRFFLYGDFCTVHGRDAEYVAESILNTKSVIRYIGHSKLASLSVNANKFTGLLKELILIRCYRVEIYEKNERWTLKTKASPGNLGELEELVYSDTIGSEESRGLIAVKISGHDEVKIGISFIDEIDRFINVVEFEDNQYLTLFEALLVQLGPRECLVPSDCESLTCYQRLRSIILMNNILLTMTKSQDFKTKEVEDEVKTLKKLLREETNSTEFLEKSKLGLSAFLASIKFLNLMQSVNFGQFILNPLDTKSFVRVDSSAISSLNLFSTARTGNNKDLDSVYALLNYCKTAPGQRLLAQWIRQPLTDVHKIEERLNLVECFVNDVSVRQGLSDSFLRSIPDLIKLSKKLHWKKASLADLFRVSLAIDGVDFMFSELKSLSNNTVNEAILEPLNTALKQLLSLNNLIKDTIEYEEIMKGPVVKPSYNKSLTDESKNLKDIESKAQHKCSKIAKDLKLEIGKGLKIDCNDTIGFFLRVTKKEERALRDKQNYIIVEKAKKDGIRFLNRDLQELNEDYLRIRRRYESLQKEVVTQIISSAAIYSDQIRNLGFILATLDVVVSLAVAAGKADVVYVRPTIMSKGSGKIVLKQIRHPCVEIKHNVSYIPNDVEFEDQKFFLVTGPNMGGKSTYIRSVGICVLMAQIGSFVPAESAIVSVVDGIYTRIGASDKQIKGYSTFMMEMIETNSILRSATENSLVIIDELGRGTSTYEGYGLAHSISSYIATEIKAYCLFATHFHELTELSKAIPSIGNLHVTALTTQDTLTFMYKVEKGSCDQSFGIHVAELAKFPKHMLELSANKVKELEGFQLSAESEKAIIEQVNEFDVDAATDEEVKAFVAKLRAEHGQE